MPCRVGREFGFAGEISDFQAEETVGLLGSVRGLGRYMKWTRAPSLSPTFSSTGPLVGMWELGIVFIKT